MCLLAGAGLASHLSYGRTENQDFCPVVAPGSCRAGKGFKIGSEICDGALVASFFAVPRARLCLVLGNAAMWVLYFYVFMGV